MKSHPKLFRDYNYFSIHAESDAVMKATAGDTLIVVRVIKNGSLTCAKPCDNCVRYLKDHGIRKVFYSCWDGTMKELKI